MFISPRWKGFMKNKHFMCRNILLREILDYSVKIPRRDDNVFTSEGHNREDIRLETIDSNLFERINE